ncbi:MULTISPECIES: zinc-binding dehydrogenase [unclassified Diaminobutyricimonas]|uniref:zinc-binding dehydrogenase n=1 Tax=unclassified Diaminobutyricimonas TaxID=2643261 RepID=UPI0012F4CD17|nr:MULTISPECIES: zinc-binding dehydrogenase [unclassified Diaminobutyricimonas]
MKAWRFYGAGQPLKLEEVPDPVAKPGEIVVDVKATGLCHSDVSALDDAAWNVGKFPDHPIVLGHEPAGVVSQVGEGVTNIKIGDRVGIPSGPPNVNGYFRDGGYAEKTTALADAVVKIPDGLDFVRAASGTDAGNVAHHAVVSRGLVSAGQKVGIIGVGGLGQVGARIAVLRGAEVYAAEVKEDVWPMAKELGVVRVAKDIREFADVGLDTIIDFAGFGTTTTGALEVVRNGGRVVQVGMGRLQIEFNTDPLILKQVDYVGSMGGGVEDLAGIYELMASGDLDPKITLVDFDKIDEGLDQLRRGTVTGRLVVDMQNGI